MYTTKLRKVGGSVMLAVPPAILDMLNLQAGANVDLSAEGDNLVVRSQRKPRYSLDELLAQCDENAPLGEDDLAWLEAPPIGREL